MRSRLFKIPGPVPGVTEVFKTKLYPRVLYVYSGREEL